MLCMLPFNFVNYVLLLCYVFLLLYLCILIVIYSYSCVYVYLLLCMFRSVYFVSLCCSVYCLCVNVYCTVLLAPGVNSIAVNKYIISYVSF